jgi:hypothetical protein
MTCKLNYQSLKAPEQDQNGFVLLDLESYLMEYHSQDPNGMTPAPTAVD